MGIPEIDGAFALIGVRTSLAGSMMGETQEMLDFSAQHMIVSDNELSAMNQVNEACERGIESDARYRFVTAIATISA